MAKNQDNDTSLERIVRRIVREEVRSMFSFDEDEADDNSPQMFSDSAVKVGDQTIRTSRRRRRKSAIAKGKVMNPSTDRRLKANRDANP